VIFEAGHELTADDICQNLKTMKITDLPTLAIDHLYVGPYIRNTMLIDKCDTREEALIDIYRVMRPGEPPTVDSAETLVPVVVL
jgi:DNA-directed RNA polymerase subunit beta